MSQAKTEHTTSDERLEQLEAPICAAIDMAAVCIVAYDHLSSEAIPNGTYIQVNRETWNTLGFALRHQQDLAKAVLVAFEAQADAP
jgi:hypothetical protein